MNDLTTEIFPMMAQAAADNSNAALIVFTIYTVAVFVLAGICYFIQSKKSFLSEYFLGSRGLGVIAFTLTFAATSASAGSFAGFPAMIYVHGWVLAFWIAGYMLVPLIAMALFGKRLNLVARQTGAITLPDVFLARFQNPVVPMLATVMIIMMLSLFLIPQFKIASIILGKLMANVPLYHSVTIALSGITKEIPLLVDVDVEYLLCLLVFAVMVILYTSFGGFRAVVWTDMLQGFIMFFGVIFMFVLTLWQVGGLPNSMRQLSKMTPPRLGTVVFETNLPSSQLGLHIAADSWFTIGNESNGETKLFRTNELAIIHPSNVQSNKVKVVQITTAEEIAAIISRFKGGNVPTLPDSVKPRIIELHKYRFGAGKPGVYVTAPGPDANNENGFLPLAMAFSFFVLWSFGNAGQPANMIRIMAFNTVTTLKRSIVVLSLYFGLIYFPLVIIFCCARIVVPGLDQTPDRIMPVMAFKLAEEANIPWLAGLLVAVPFAAAMSTVDSFMIMISSALVRDVYQCRINPDVSEKNIKRLSYACTLIIGFIVTLGSINPPRFLQVLIVFTIGGLAAVFFFPVTLVLYWKRFNAIGAVASMLGGFAVYVSLYVGGFLKYGTTRPLQPIGLDPLIFGFAASLSMGIIFSLLSPPPPQHLVRKFFL
ncbi:MAG: hypothetical protein JXA04_12385 [Gammaproteobacteria bacterium]|nr:hypothetical protein [Gammaproteobacteria bacterium]